jgi:hypothetical protein
MRPFSTPWPRTVNWPLTLFRMLMIEGWSSGAGARLVLATS